MKGRPPTALRKFPVPQNDMICNKDVFCLVMKGKKRPGAS